MIICHCNCITAADIEYGVRCALERCPGVVPCPHAVYEELGACANCANCFPVAEHCIKQALLSFVPPEQLGIVATPAA
jgi:hypothetical protein